LGLHAIARRQPACFCASDTRADLAPNMSLEGVRVAYYTMAWPQRNASAGSVRVFSILRSLQHAGAAVTMLCPGKPSNHSKELGECGVDPVRNATNALADEASHALNGIRPHAVIFNGLAAEEHFGWQVRQWAQHQDLPCPPMVLDTQDLHGVRLMREAMCLDAAPLEPASVALDCSHDSVSEDTGALGLQAAMGARPDASHPTVLRELLALSRCDAAWVVSAMEIEMLQKQALCASVPEAAGMSSQLLVQALQTLPVDCLPFEFAENSTDIADESPFVPPPSVLPSQSSLLPFSERSGFVFVGNMQHGPNRDALLWMGQIWPRIRAQLPGATMRVYGPCMRKVDKEALHRPECGMLVLGQAPNLSCMTKARVLLAPLRYGAGIKGKIAEAWARGTPVVTTPIGSEGMWQDWSSLSSLGEARSLAGPPLEGDAKVWMQSHSLVPARIPTWPKWGGAALCQNGDELAAAAVALHQNEELWRAASAVGRSMTEALYGFSPFQRTLIQSIRALTDARRGVSLGTLHLSKSAAERREAVTIATAIHDLR